jgi:hypothetical protein
VLSLFVTIGCHFVFTPLAIQHSPQSSLSIGPAQTLSSPLTLLLPFLISNWAPTRLLSRRSRFFELTTCNFERSFFPLTPFVSHHSTTRAGKPFPLIFFQKTGGIPHAGHTNFASDVPIPLTTRRSSLATRHFPSNSFHCHSYAKKGEGVPFHFGTRMRFSASNSTTLRVVTSLLLCLVTSFLASLLRSSLFRYNLGLALLPWGSEVTG